MINDMFISILNWNGLDDTYACIQSLLLCDTGRFCAVVMDNGSDDKPESIKNIVKSLSNSNLGNIIYLDTEEELKLAISMSTSSYRKVVLFYKHPENLGFAAGNNFLLRKAFETGYQKYLLLNNDTVVEKDFLDKLIEANETSKIDVLTPNIYYFSKPDTVWNSGGRLTFVGSRKYHNAGKKVKKYSKAIKNITFITGCAMYLHRRIIEKVGYLTEDYFFGEEDYDFSLRLHEMRCKVACIYTSVIYHRVGATIKKNNELSRVILFYVSRLINLKKHTANPLTWILRYSMYGLYIRYFLLFKKMYSYNETKSICNYIVTYIKSNNSVLKNNYLEIMSYRLN